MATNLQGPLGEHNGRLGPIVYYKLNGRWVSRTIGRNKNERTPDQRQQQELIKICGQFLKHFKEIINVGFSIEALGTDKNQFNLAMKNNTENLVKGRYPNMWIAYDQLVLSKGRLKTPVNPRVVKNPEGLEFTWDTDRKMAWPDANDQAILVAYFPKTKQMINSMFGNSRVTGLEVLEIPETMREEHMETYLFFVSADRKRVSGSSYTGSINKID